MATQPSFNRRIFVKTLTGAGLATLAGGPRWEAVHAADDVSRHGNRIDTHHHFLPPEYVRIVGRDAIARPAPNGAPDWDVAKSLKMMDDNGIAAAVVSISTPGIWFGNAARARHLARLCNQFAAQMAADHPDRFGFFATLPLPDVAGSLAELQHATDALKCDGIGLMTNYGDRYLGDRLFDPVFAEMNQRRVTVYVHPYVCSCDQTLLPGIPSAMIEFPHSTTRALVGLLSNGVFTRYPNIRFIFSHAGGTMPYLVKRIVGQANGMGRKGWGEPLQTCYYDTASSANDVAFGPLLKLTDSKHVLFGTDFPFVAAPAVAASIAGLQTLGLARADVTDIEGANARRLFPRLA